MTVLAIGDIHGLATWRQAVADCPEADRIVFVGDYFDAFDVDTDAQLANFEAILALRQGEPDRVTLLLGNHDFHYLSYVVARYSGYSFVTQRVLGKRIDTLVDQGILEAAAYLDGRLYTHSGVTRSWAEDWDVAVAPAELPTALSELLHHRPRAFGFHTDAAGGGQDPSGNDVWQGPLWVRPRSLRAAAYWRGQIFGHTVVGPRGIVPDEVGFSVDALWRGQWAVVRDGVVEVRAEE